MIEDVIRIKEEISGQREYSIFTEQISRKPNRYPWAETFINVMHEGFWTDREFDFHVDLHQFKTLLTDNEREVIVRTLSAIGQIEVAVKTFWAKLGDNLPHPSLQDLGYVMANVEVIHNNAYERLLSVLDMEDIFEKNLQLDWIQGRVKYLRKYTHRFYKDSKKQYLYAIILFTLFVENVSLFSQFYIINWFGKRNLLKDVDQQVRYTRNEENIHALVGIKIINTIREEHPELFDEELVLRIIHEAHESFKAESRICEWMLEGLEPTNDLSKEVLQELIKDRINKSLVEIQFPEAFTVDAEILKNTEWFYEELLGNNLTDFFHSKPTEYSKSNRSFTMDDDAFNF